MRRQGRWAQSIWTVVAMMTAVVMGLAMVGSAVATAAIPGPPATPGASPSASGRQGGPRVGDQVAYINESGGTIATLKVTRMEQPWTGFGDYYTPDSGSEYIAFVIEVTHLGTRGDLIVKPDDFRLQDADGFLLSRAWVSAADTAQTKPSSDPVAIAPGATGEVVVVFQVLQGVGLSQLVWQPEYDRMTTLADLRGDLATP